MSAISQAIKIEQLKNERAKMTNPLRLQLISDVTPRIRDIDNQIEQLGKERKELIAKAVELRERIKSFENHFDLMIEAYQSLSKNSMYGSSSSQVRGTTQETMGTEVGSQNSEIKAQNTPNQSCRVVGSNPTSRTQINSGNETK